MPQERRDRAAARATWPVRIFRLGGEPSETIEETTTPEERLAMVWPLTLEAWELMGRAIPDYPRSEAPVAIVPRPADAPRQS